MKEVEVINSIEIPNNILEPFKVYVRIRPFLSKEIFFIKFYFICKHFKNII